MLSVGLQAAAFCKDDQAMEIEGEIISCDSYKFQFVYRAFLISLIILIGQYLQIYVIAALMIKI